MLTFTTAALLMGGCVASGQAGYSANAQVTTPDLVYIDSDVQVIADYDEPIFYSGNYYWRYDGGAWYRSTYHTRGWVRYDNAPVAIRRIDRPTAYIHYHANASASARPEVRDHRDSPPPPPPVSSPPPPPPSPAAIREERKEERKEMKEERKDERKDMKEERKDEKQDRKEERKDEKKDRKEDRKDDKKKGR
ncbi:MAG: hypothetical protein ABI175_16350 [Polyangiales bacterium]